MVNIMHAFLKTAIFRGFTDLELFPPGNFYWKPLPAFAGQGSDVVKLPREGPEEMSTYIRELEYEVLTLFPFLSRDVPTILVGLVTKEQAHLALQAARLVADRKISTLSNIKQQP